MNIEIGKTYLNRNGDIIEITGQDKSKSPYEFHDLELNYYAIYGFVPNAYPFEMDLVQEYIEVHNYTSKVMYSPLTLTECALSIWSHCQTDYDNIRAEFNPDTGELISIEKIT